LSASIYQNVTPIAQYIPIGAHRHISLNSFQSICEYVCTALEIFQRTHFNKLYNVRE